MDTQEIRIYTNHPEEVEEDTEVATCTSEFPYDAVTENFENKLSATMVVEVEHIGEDYSEYVQGKSCNGGCYGYDYWRVINVVEE